MKSEVRVFPGKFKHPGLAQSGSAPALGAGGRGFKSLNPDQTRLIGGSNNELGLHQPVFFRGIAKRSKARSFDVRIPWFESRYPCHFTTTKIMTKTNAFDKDPKKGAVKALKAVIMIAIIQSVRSQEGTDAVKRKTLKVKVAEFKLLMEGNISTFTIDRLLELAQRSGLSFSFESKTTRQKQIRLAMRLEPSVKGKAT